MVKPSNDPKPAGPVRRAVRTVARHVNVRAADRTRQRIFAEELDEQPQGEERAELVHVVAPTPGPGCFARLGGQAGAGLAVAGLLAATAAAAFAGVVDAGLDKVMPPAVTVVPVAATCAEPASWCGGASR